jgi:Lon-like ATP-dependent protease
MVPMEYLNVNYVLFRKYQITELLLLINCRIAFTYSKWFLGNIDTENNFLIDNRVHLHVPEGAIPKDGPSAGCTIVTAIMSLATGIPVRENLAMTGEISLRGRVLAVGGIKEKVIAAKRAGVDTVILPVDNKKDYADLPQLVKEDVNVYFADTYQDVYNIAFPKYDEIPSSTKL